MKNNFPAHRFPDWKVWLVFGILSGGLLMYLFLVDRDFVSSAIDQQNRERIHQFSRIDSIPRVVFIGSSLLKHAVPFDTTFDTLFTKTMGNPIRSMRMVRYQGSINQFTPSLNSFIENPPDYIFIDKASLLSNKYQVRVSVAEYYRFKIRQLFGTKENALTFALEANTKKDEKLFRRIKQNNISLTDIPDSATLSPKINGLFHQYSKKKQIFSKELASALKKLMEKGTKIRILEIPRIDVIDAHPLLLAFDRRLKKEISETFGSEISQIQVPVRPELTMYCNPGHLNVTGRDFFISQLIPLINQEIYGNSVR